MAKRTTARPLCFILAPAYHGAGTLAWRLGHHKDIFSLGTNNPLRDFSQTCSCGETVDRCLFWSQAAEKMEIDDDAPIRTFFPQAPYLVPHDRINALISGILSVVSEISPSCWKLFYESAERFYSLHDKFLSLCAGWTPHKLLIDAERSNLKFMVMASMGFPIKYGIHLVRDPRSYVHQWRKFYPHISVEQATMEWVAAHRRIKWLKRLRSGAKFKIVRYEDLMENPQETLIDVIEFLGFGKVWPEELHLDPYKNHLIGLGPQDTDGMAPKAEKWRESMDLADQKRVLKAAGSLFSEFGYKP